MGRILRAKRRTEKNFRSRFYTLVSRDTDEVQFSAKRRRFLVDQGYEFKVISDYTNMIPEEELSLLNYYSAKEQYELLNIVKTQDDTAGLDEIVETTVDDLAGEWNKAPDKRKKKGGDAPVASASVKEKRTHSLFKKWAKNRTFNWHLK